MAPPSARGHVVVEQRVRCGAAPQRAAGEEHLQGGSGPDPARTRSIDHPAPSDAERRHRADGQEPGQDGCDSEAAAVLAVGGEPDPEGGVGEDVGVGAERRGRAGAPGEPPVDEVGGHGEACQPRVSSADDGGEVAAGQGEEVGGAEVGAILEQAEVRARQQPAGRDPAPTRRRGEGQEQAVERGHLGQGAWMQAGLVDRAFGRRDEEVRPRGRAPASGGKVVKQVVGGRAARTGAARGGRASARGAAHRRGVGLPADRRSLSTRIVSKDPRTVATQLRATRSPQRSPSAPRSVPSSPV